MKHFLMAMSILLFSQLAQGIPSAFVSKCGALNIKNDTTSTILRDNEDCKTAWVLPPTFGLVNLTGYMPNANLGLCQEVKDVQKMSNSLLGRIERTENEMKELIALQIIKKKELLEAKKLFSDLESSTEFQDIKFAEAKVARAEENVQELLAQLKSCGVDCDAIREELRIIKEDRAKAKGVLSQLQSRCFEIMQRHRAAKARMEYAQNDLETFSSDLTILNENQIKLKDTLNNWLQFYSKLEGGTAFLNYDSQWTESTQRLNKAYQGKIQFQQVPTRNARITANFIGNDNEVSSLAFMPAILDYAIHGTKFTPWGEQGAIEQTALPSRISGSVRLSLMGGCPMYFKNFLDSDTLARDDKLERKLNFAISATYEYPAAFKYNVTATYNLFKIYEEVKNFYSNVGIFSSDQFDKVIAFNDSRDTFEINWHLENERYSAEQQQEITKYLKSELLGRIMVAMGTPNNSGINANRAPAPMPTESAAMTLAKGIDSICGYYNLYCLGSSWIMRGLNSAFGSSETESKFRSTNNYLAKETWKTSQAGWRAGATGYAGKL